MVVRKVSSAEYEGNVNHYMREARFGPTLVEYKHGVSLLIIRADSKAAKAVLQKAEEEERTLLQGRAT